MPLIWTRLKFCRLVKGYSFTKRQILDSSKLKEFAGENFEFNENGESSQKGRKCCENTVGIGEIGRNEQFLLFPQCFQETWPADR